MGERLAGVDAARVVFCLAVVVLHSLPGLSEPIDTPWVLVAAAAARAAVPFFFIASGYFLKTSEFSTRLWFRPLRRLLPAYLFWLAAYNFVDLLSGGNVQFGWRDLLTGGRGFHLWYLPALGVALAAVGTLLATVGRAATGLICFGLAMTSLLIGSYATVAGLPEIAGQRMLAAPLFVFIGAALADRQVRVPLRPAALAVLVAWAAVIGEEYLIATLGQTAVVSNAIIVSTYALGTAAFLFALALPAQGEVGRLAVLGPVTLGVYAAHLFFVRIFVRCFGNETPLQVLAAAVPAFAAALLVSMAMARVRLLRPVVA